MNWSITAGGRTYTPEGTPHILGVVNLSPESPNKDSIAASTDAAVARARALVAEGAAMIDVGAQSSHFSTPLLSPEEERDRLLPGLRALKAAGLTVSVDTWRPLVAEAALAEGADLINDSDGFQDPAMIALLAAARVPVILPFISGPSPHDPVPFNYADPLTDMLPWFERALDRAAAAGLREIILDPGTGYVYPGVTPEEKLVYQRIVYRDLHRIRALGFPVLVALPRKQDPVLTRELAQMIVDNGADFLRAHEPALGVAVRAARATTRPGGAVR